MKARITITLKPGVLDPQGQAVEQALPGGQLSVDVLADPGILDPGQNLFRLIGRELVHCPVAFFARGATGS